MSVHAEKRHSSHRRTRLRGDAIPLILVWIGSAYFAIRYSEMATQRYELFRAQVDTGIFLQILSSAFSGFHSTVEGNANHMVVHFSPILFFFAPLVILTHDPLVPSFLQAIAGALVGPAIFLIARRRVGSWLALGCAGVALLYAPLGGVVFTDFHEASFTPAATAWLLWAIDAGAFWPAIAIGLVALGIKEDVAPGVFTTGVTGALWFARRRDRVRRTICVTVAVSALVAFLAYFFLVRPAYHTNVPYWSFHFYDFQRAAPGDPNYWPVFDARRLWYVVHALNPLVWLPLLSPAAILSGPGFAEVLASHEAITMNIGTHYAATWIGYLLVAFVLGVSTLYKRSRLVAAIVLAAAIVSTYRGLVVDDPFARWYYLYRSVDSRDRAMAAMIRSLPADADVGAPDRLFAHLGFDPNAGLTLDHQFILFDKRDTDLSGTWMTYARTLERLVGGGFYKPVRDVDGLVLYERAKIQ